MERMTVLVGHISATHLDQHTPAQDELLPPLEAMELPQGVLQALAPLVPQLHLRIKRLPAASAVDLAQAPTATAHTTQERVAGDQRRMLPSLPETGGERALPALPALPGAALLAQQGSLPGPREAVVSIPAPSAEVPMPAPSTLRATDMTGSEREQSPAQAGLVMVRAASAQPAWVAAELPPMRTPSLPATLRMPIDAPPSSPPGEGLRVPFDNGRVSGTLLITGNESTQGMLVTPDKSVLLEQLREPFSRLDQPAWRLSERADDRDQGRRQAHADEPEDEPEQPR